MECGQTRIERAARVSAGDISTIEMGARQYVPLLGRFLSVDPVPGGNANDYNYPNDPLGETDLTGLKGGGQCHKSKACAVVLRKKAAAVARSNARLYSKQNEESWKRVAFASNTIGLVTTFIPGVDVIGGVATGTVSAGADCPYRNEGSACGWDVVGIFTAGIGALPSRIAKGAGMVPFILSNLFGDSARTS